jgi:hypothetical protein
MKKRKLETWVPVGNAVTAQYIGRHLLIRIGGGRIDVNN